MFGVGHCRRNLNLNSLFEFAPLHRVFDIQRSSRGKTACFPGGAPRFGGKLDTQTIMNSTKGPTRKTGKRRATSRPGRRRHRREVMIYYLCLWSKKRLFIPPRWRKSSRRSRTQSKTIVVGGTVCHRETESRGCKLSKQAFRRNGSIGQR